LPVQIIHSWIKEKSIDKLTQEIEENKNTEGEWKNLKILHGKNQNKR
jgi:hypothetical protein